MDSAEQPLDGLKMSQVAKMTGVGAHALRAWERRYGVPRPGRSDGRQRLYSIADVELINRMRELAAEGVALAHAARTALREFEARQQTAPAPASDMPERLLDALLVFDESAAARLWAEMVEGADLATVFEAHLLPLLVRVGEGWHDGSVTIGQEHFASAFIRGRLDALVRQVIPPRDAPTVVLACLQEERHELGIMMLNVLLRFSGLRTVYLGPDVPDDALIRTVEDIQPQVLALHATRTENAERMPGLVADLIRQAPLTQVAFGGYVFDHNPEFREIPGAQYAGGSLRNASEKISRLARHRETGGIK